MQRTGHNLAHSISIAFIGFGEAAKALVSGWNQAATVITHAYDRKTDVDGPTRTPSSTLKCNAGHFRSEGVARAEEMAR